MDLRFIERGSEEWRAARVLRHRVFFEAHELPLAVMDDEQEGAAFHLAGMADGEIVAYGRLFDLGGGWFQISQMVVAPAWQGKSIGRRVLQVLIGRARESGATGIVLKARLSAEHFYAKAGFQRCGEPFPSAKTAVPHVEMKLEARESIEAIECDRERRAAVSSGASTLMLGDCRDD